MDILKISQTENQIKQIINQSGLNVAIMRLIIKNIEHEIDDLYYQTLEQAVQDNLEIEQKDRDEESENNGD